ncbi:hypothetical protein GBA52_002991 [Prunus armeniaca]|nr:hypothetical protein GBA52_002991 [Prunus armeniaca]
MNNCEDDVSVQAQLDRGFGNLALLHQWGNFTIYHLSAYSYDHYPIFLLLDSRPSVDVWRRQSTRRFQFEEQWTTGEDCERIIQEGWHCQESPTTNLAICAKCLSKWKSQKFSHMNSKIQSPLTSWLPFKLLPLLKSFSRARNWLQMSSTVPQLTQWYLSLLFTREEVEIAIKSMGPTKAPGCDGMPTLFYQRYWSIIGSDIC